MAHPFSIRLPDDIDNRLEELTKKTGRPKSFYVKEAITEYLEDLEDYYLADRVIAQSKPNDYVTHASLKRELGIK